MKKIFFIAFLLIRDVVLGQIDYQNNVCTPKGDIIVAYSTAESDTTTRAYYDSYYSSAYPNAQQIKTYDNYSSTRKYNCHGYAWHVSDGGSDRWIGYYDGNTDEYDYWLKGSYVEVGYEYYPGKVSWASGDHSAITTTTSGWFISKWNEFPLMFHRWDDSPYGSSNLKYYRLNFSISGPSILCSNNETYTLSNTPGGSNTWGKSSNLAFNGSNTGQSVSIIPSTNGSGYVNVTFTSGCGTSFTVPQKEVWVGPYSSTDYPITGPSSAPCRQYVYYSIPDLVGVVSINWFWPSGWTYVSGQGTRSLALQTGTTGSGGIVGAQAINICNNPGSYATKYTTVTGTCGYSLSVSPNPTSSEVTIALATEDPVKQTSAIEWDLDVYDSFQGLKEKKTKLKTAETKINTSGWKDGMYVVRATIDGQTLTEKLIVKH